MYSRPQAGTSPGSSAPALSSAATPPHLLNNHNKKLRQNTRVISLTGVKVTGRSVLLIADAICHR